MTHESIPNLDSSFWQTRPGRITIAVGAAIMLGGALACNGEGTGTPAPEDTGEYADIIRGSDFYFSPNDLRVCATTSTQANHVRIVKHQNGLAGVSDTDTTTGLPGYGSACRTNTDDNDAIMWTSNGNLKNRINPPQN